MSFPNLFRAIEIGGVSIPNRFALTATAEVFSHPDGLTNHRYTSYLEHLARAGVGLLILGNRLAHPLSGTPARGYTWGYRPEIVAHDQRLTAAIHETPAKVFAQLVHFGAHGNSFAHDDYRVLKGPSRLPSPVWNETPDAMDRSDLEETAGSFARCAELAREGGFDGVELHMTNAYLLHQFMSPLYNNREDEYGGSLENRLRFPLEVLERVRERVGGDYPLGVRLTTNENHPEGMGLSEWMEVAKRFSQSGMADFMGFSAGTYHSFGAQVGIEDMPQYYLCDEIAKIRSEIEIPVIASGAMQDPFKNEELVRSGQVDIIGLSRPLMADGDYVTKVRDGREDEIRRCIRCNQGCIARLFKAVAVGCTINPEFGRERFFASLKKRPVLKKRVVVVGGGPAGMRAATRLAQRGHVVTLFEKDSVLGGQVRLIARQPGRSSFKMLIEDLEREIDDAGVDVQLGAEVTGESIRSLTPDTVILATGSRAIRTGFSAKFPFVLSIPGLDQIRSATVPEILRDGISGGERVLILDDEGTRYTAGTAEFILDNGGEVVLLTALPQIFPGLGFTLEQSTLFSRLFQGGLKPLTNSWLGRIEGTRAVAYNVYSAKEEAIEGIDIVVTSTGREPDLALYDTLRDGQLEVHRIGDCLAPRLLDQAMYDAELAGYEVLDDPSRFIEPGTLEAASA